MDNRKKYLSPITLLVTGLVLLAASWILVSECSANEPFYGKPMLDEMIIFVGIPCVIFVIWLYWSLNLIVCVIRHSFNRWIVFAIVLPIVASTMLHTTVVEYAGDVGDMYEIADKIIRNYEEEKASLEENAINSSHDSGANRRAAPSVRIVGT